MYIRQAIDLLEGLFTGVDEYKELTVRHVQKLIVFAIMWSLGALLELDDRKKVCDYTVNVLSSSSSCSLSDRCPVCLSVCDVGVL